MNRPTKSNEKSTSPKSNREYITSFTTTTTTTQKPHIEKGVKIIRNLVERARNNEDGNVEKPIQSLTTMKPMTTSRGKSTTTLRSTTLPINHKLDSDETMKKSIHPHHFHHSSNTSNITFTDPAYDLREPLSSNQRVMKSPTAKSSSNNENSTKTPSPPPKSTGIDSNVLKSSTAKSSSNKEKASITSTETAITINDVEDLINKVQTTTRNGKASTIRTKSTTPIPSDSEDIDFLKQVVNFI